MCTDRKQPEEVSSDSSDWLYANLINIMRDIEGNTTLDSIAEWVMHTHGVKKKKRPHMKRVILAAFEELRSV